MKKVIHVAAGVIVRGENIKALEILLAKRPEHTHKGGLWEFPGGKVEAQEAVHEALARELKEELAIDVQSSSPLLQVPYDYPEKAVLLDVWLVSQFAGQPVGNEGQDVRWVALSNLPDYSFPEANVAIVEFLQSSAFLPAMQVS